MCYAILQDGLRLFVCTLSLLRICERLLCAFKSLLFSLSCTAAYPRLLCVLLYGLLEGERGFAHLDGGLFTSAGEPCLYGVETDKHICALGQTQVVVGEEFVAAYLFISRLVIEGGS